MEVTYYEKAMSDIADCKRMLGEIIAERDRLRDDRQLLVTACNAVIDAYRMDQSTVNWSVVANRCSEAVRVCS